MEIKPLAFAIRATPLTPTADEASQQKNTRVTESDPSKSTLQQFSSENIGYAGTGANKPLSGHIVTDAAASTAPPALTREEVAHALNQVKANLAPFFVPCDESNASHIFVLNEKGDAIELEENKLDPNFRDTHHEAAKAHFIANYEALYGKAVLDTFYPEELRKKPLSLGQAHLLREQLNEFQKSVEAACQEDPSKYDATLKAQLETLHQVEKAVGTAFESEGPLKTEVASLEKYLSEQTGVSAETVHTCLLAGTAIAAVAATASGLALPAALHAAATGILSHAGVASAAALTAKGTPLAASIGSEATAMSSASTLHNIASCAAHAGASAAIGASLGAAAGAVGGLYAATANGVDYNTAWISIPMLTLAGMSTGATGGGALGLAAGVVGPAAVATLAGSAAAITGAAFGAVGGAMLAASPNGNPGAVVGGMAAGAVVGGVVVGGAVYLAGGLCSAVAHLATGAIAI